MQSLLENNNYNKHTCFIFHRKVYIVWLCKNHQYSHKFKATMFIFKLILGSIWDRLKCPWRMDLSSKQIKNRKKFNRYPTEKKNLIFYSTTTWGWPKRGIKLQKKQLSHGVQDQWSNYSTQLWQSVFGVLCPFRFQTSRVWLLKPGHIPGGELHYSLSDQQKFEALFQSQKTFPCAPKGLQLSLLIWLIIINPVMFTDIYWWLWFGSTKPAQSGIVGNTFRVITPANDEQQMLCFASWTMGWLWI